MAIDKPLPSASSQNARVDPKTGMASSQQKRWEESQYRTLAQLVDAANAPKSWEQSWLIEYPDEKSYPLVINAQIARTITGMTVQTSTGTCTVTGDIDGTPLSGSANSASSTESTEEHDDQLPAGGNFAATVSTVSGAEDLSITIYGTYQ